MIEFVTGLLFFLFFIFLITLAFIIAIFSQKIFFSLKKENPLRFKEIYGSTESIFEFNKSMRLRFTAYKYLLKIDEEVDSIKIKKYKRQMKKIHSLLIVSLFSLLGLFYYILIFGVIFIGILFLIPS